MELVFVLGLDIPFNNVPQYYNASDLHHNNTPT